MTEPRRDESEDGEGKAEAKPWKPPARNTIHNEIVTLISMVLKTARRVARLAKAVAID